MDLSDVPIKVEIGSTAYAKPCRIDWDLCLDGLEILLYPRRDGYIEKVLLSLYHQGLIASPLLGLKY
jgi:hypothetical protein